MRLYLDESNLPRLDKINPSSPYFIMGGCIIRNGDIDLVHYALKKFVKENFPENSYYSDFKLHASAMYNLRDNFSGYTKENILEKLNLF